MSFVKLLIFCICSGAMSWAAAELVPMSDDDLDAIYGQGIVRIDTNTVTQAHLPGNQSFDFTRITIGADIELSGLIDEFVLGQGYERPFQPAGQFSEGETLPGGAEFVGVRRECIGLDLCGGLFTRVVNEVEEDLRITNFAFGDVNDAGEIQPFLFQNPYVEFAFANNDDPATRRLVGVRLGFENADGIAGANLDILSGAIQVIAAAELLPGLDVNLPVLLNGVRNDGFGGEVPLVGSLSIPLAQLSRFDRFQTLDFQNSQNFFIGLQFESVDYPQVGACSAALPNCQLVAPEGFYANFADNVVVNLAGAFNADQRPNNAVVPSDVSGLTPAQVQQVSDILTRFNSSFQLEP